MRVQPILTIAMALCGFIATACTDDLDAVDPVLQSGVEDSAGFAPFRTGDTMEILTGVQAGVWMMPTVRHQGFVGDPELICTVLDMDKDTLLADQAAHANSKQHEGWTNVLYNMEVILPDEEMSDEIELQNYSGDRVLFECTAKDGAENVRIISHEMVLTVR